MPQVDRETDLDELVVQIQSVEKYASILPGLIRLIGSRELSKRKNLKEAIKETKSKLHQVGSAYQEKTSPYGNWKAELQRLPRDLSHPDVQQKLIEWMRGHTSTKERISILPRFFKETLASLPEIQTILDLACGLNPLALPWMPFNRDIAYHACDIYLDLIEFLNGYSEYFLLQCHAFPCDLTSKVPPIQVDLAMILKTIPCLEQMDKQIGYGFLEQINAPNLLVSFPAHSLTGKGKGMVRNYEAHFMELISDKSWKLTRYEFPGELAFLIRR